MESRRRPLNASNQAAGSVLSPFSGPGLVAEIITGGFLVYLLGGGGRLDLAGHLYLSGLAACAVWALSSAALRGHVGGGDSPGLGSWLPRARAPEPRLRSLEQVEHAVDFALATAFDLHFWLRPHLTAVAKHRLSGRGISLDDQPEAALRLLGPELWELVRPERALPAARSGDGIDPARLERAVARLEAL